MSKRPSPSDERPIVCVDLNGVLDAYTGWRGPEHWDPPRAGATDFLQQLRGRGFRAIVHTTRWRDDAVERLRQYGAPNKLFQRRPPAIDADEASGESEAQPKLPRTGLTLRRRGLTKYRSPGCRSRCASARAAARVRPIAYSSGFNPMEDRKFWSAVTGQ
ncbi:MAG TPA: hypothetical protein VI391_00575, partial [Thermoanaerobaculia bacterium]